MSSALPWFVVLLVSLYVLIRASDYFTSSAERIGLSFNIPTFIVGVTIVALGTSLPEIISSIFAVLSDSSEIVIGNVVGSNITNIFLVVGVAALLGKKMKVTYELVHIDLPLLMGSALFLAVTVWDGTFTLFEAMLCLAGITVYLLHAVSTKKRRRKRGHTATEESGRERVTGKTVFILALSAFFIYLGGRFTIESVIRISEILDIGKEIIAASAVALGTSLPELVVSITAARKGEPELAIGNVLGSNIFNALAVMGIPALIAPLTIPVSIVTFGIPMMLIASLLFFFMAQDKEITNWEGLLLLIFYVFFIGKLFNL
jgi:cation:H+ antiporter